MGFPPLLYPPVATLYLPRSAHQATEREICSRQFYMGFLFGELMPNYFHCSNNISHFTVRNIGRHNFKRLGKVCYYYFLCME